MSPNVNRDRPRLLGAAAAMVAGAPIEVPAANGNLPSLSGATGWLNSAQLSADQLHGKVVLVEFWTYTCINWLGQLPYVRAWAEKYGPHGLVVVGVHSSNSSAMSTTCGARP